MIECGSYDTLPSYALQSGKLASGYDKLAKRLISKDFTIWIIDGMSGVDWDVLQYGLQAALKGHDAAFIDCSSARLGPRETKKLLTDWLDNDDAVFGKLYPGGLIDFFDPQELEGLRQRAHQEAQQSELVICFGQGSALLGLDGGVGWVDLPKEIITESALSGKDVLLGTPSYPAQKSMYWVDWPVMERHKVGLLPKLDLYIDLSDSNKPLLIEGYDLRAQLTSLSQQPFRVKPIFYPGTWGGQWMKRHMQLDPSKPNYAWSYELIAPENGVLIRDGELYLEIPLEMMMAQETVNVQGPYVAERFGASFPIRFSYDDTIEGQNLSCQVHPQADYIADKFGEAYAQHESYYIMQAGKGGLCYLGLKETTTSAAFRHAAELARDEGVSFDTENFVNAWPTRVHDLYLIPAGTVHCSGANNLVLEIGATPYLYTFKIYDYLRRDLKGRSRPLHVERAWDNIDFNRKTKWVRQNLIPSPRIVGVGKGWTEYLIGEHPLIFYSIYRSEFTDEFTDDTGGDRFHILNLVEGESILIEWSGGSHPLHYAETILIPAATGPYQLRNQADGICKVVKAFVK